MKNYKENLENGSLKAFGNDAVGASMYWKWFVGVKKKKKRDLDLHDKEHFRKPQNLSVGTFEENRTKYI